MHLTKLIQPDTMMDIHGVQLGLYRDQEGHVLALTREQAADEKYTHEPSPLNQGTFSPHTD